MVLVQQAFKLFFVLLSTTLMACETPTPPRANLATQVYLSKFEKRVLEIEFVIAKNTATQSEIVMLFNQPMVTFEHLNHKFKNIDGVSLSPLVDGEFEWLEPQMLVFKPLNVAPESQFQIEVAAGLSSLLGTALLRPIHFEFVVSGLPNVTKAIDPADGFVTVQAETVLQWPRLSATTDSKQEASELQIKWMIPPFLKVGDRLQAIVEIQNLKEEPFDGILQIQSDGILQPLKQTLSLASESSQIIKIELFANAQLQDEILQNFLITNSISLEKSISIELQNSQGSQSVRQNVKIFSPLDFEVQDDLGVLANVKKQKVLSESFLHLQTGQLSLDFSLDAHELLKVLVIGLEESPAEDLMAKSLSLSPYVLFPKSTLAFGEEESAWQSHLDDVQHFLEELRSSMHFQLGRDFTASQLSHFAEFIALAAHAGFTVDDVKDQVAQNLLRELGLATKSSDQIAILWALSLLNQDQTLHYNEYYLSWDELDDLSQMQLAEMILKMNPLHPVAKLCKRVIDKTLFNQTVKPLSFWTAAFRTLLLINPNDSLSFEVFAQIFINLKNHRSLQNDHAALLAFQIYQENMTKIDKPVDLVVSLNNHEIMKSHLSWKNRNDSLSLPIEKMPQHVVIEAQKNSGPFAFYRLHLKGLRQFPVIPIENQGIRVNQSCYDDVGPMQSILQEHTTYTCRVRWFTPDAQNNVLFEIPRLAGSDLWIDIPKSIVSFQTAKLRVYFHQIQAGYGEFEYALKPRFQGEYVASTLRVHSTLGGFWGGGFEIKPSKVLAP